ncbi:MAG: hypothetical protein B6242_12945 [Anaerolineaceae bacterium 4572_78]|nr:MAG: hypothetical protein B6242_12945 [Anaerolineaceae bacterium 4572_78]
MNEVSNTLEMLRTKTDKVGGLLAGLGFGRRILVPPDEIHVVVGDGRHTSAISKGRIVYGQSAGQPSSYWLNSLTQVTKLKTISFTVPIQGLDNGGVEALDSSRVSFSLWAHAVAKLNPEKAEVGAQRVGLDITSLINTITKVGAAELVSAAAKMTLDKIVADRQKLTDAAFGQVNEALSELGYDLALLTITKLSGEAYYRFIKQAEANVFKDTSIKTNEAQIAEMKDSEARKRLEAEIEAETEKKLAVEKAQAQEKVESVKLEQQEKLDVRRHEVRLKEAERKLKAAQVAHEAELEEAKLAQQLARTKAEQNADLAHLQAERQAQLRAEEQKRQAEIHLAKSKDESERLAFEQTRQMERDAERTSAEAKRLRAEEFATAERAKEITLLESNQLAQAMKVESEAQAESLRIKTDSETQTQRVKIQTENDMLQIKAEAEANALRIKAETEADAIEKQARAAKIRAEATRAETAAPGLAQAEIEEAQLKVAEQRVTVTRAEGLAESVVAKAKANVEVEISEAKAKVEIERARQLKNVEIEAKRELVELYQKSPVMVELEKLRMQLEQQERLTTIEMDAHIKAFQAIAPSLDVNLYGNSGQASQIINELMVLAKGVRHLGEEVPAIGRLVNEDSIIWLGTQLRQFAPYLQQALADVNPRVMSTLRMTDLLERLASVVSGQENLVNALNSLRKDTNFRMIGDMPVKPLLDMLDFHSSDDSAEDDD